MSAKLPRGWQVGFLFRWGPATNTPPRSRYRNPLMAASQINKKLKHFNALDDGALAGTAPADKPL